MLLIRRRRPIGEPAGDASTLDGTRGAGRIIGALAALGIDLSRSQPSTSSWSASSSSTPMLRLPISTGSIPGTGIGRGAWQPPDQPTEESVRPAILASRLATSRQVVGCSWSITRSTGRRPRRTSAQPPPGSSGWSTFGVTLRSSRPSRCTTSAGKSCGSHSAPASCPTPNLPMRRSRRPASSAGSARHGSRLPAPSLAIT